VQGNVTTSFFQNLVSFRSHSVHAYDSDDLAHRVGSHCKPLDQMRLAYQSCGQRRSALVVEAAAAIIRSCSFYAVVGVVSGNRNQPAADVNEDGRWAACEV
jgi:hypothetical protein